MPGGYGDRTPESYIKIQTQNIIKKPDNKHFEIFSTEADSAY